MPTTYYKLHGGRLSFAEYWRMSPDPFTFLLASGMKIFGGFPFNFSIPRIEELHLVEWDDIPKAARRAMSPNMELFEEAGFEFVFCHQLPVLEEHRLGVGAALLAPGGLVFATVNYAQDKVTRQCQSSCVTRFDDEAFGITTTQKKQMKPDPRHLVERYPGTPADELYRKHKGHLRDWEDEGRRPVKLTKQTLADVVLEGERGHVDFHADRGVYVPMTKAEIRKIRAAQEAAYDED